MAKTTKEEMEQLIGYTFKKGWTITAVHTSGRTPTGGLYSMCFDVTDGKHMYFMKALDFRQYIQQAENKGEDIDYVACLKRMTDQYLYERDLSRICIENRVRNVACMIDDGQEPVDRLGNIIVPYMVFDMASYDLREKLDITEKLDFAWKMKSLHNVAVGLSSLHKVGITHQDIKPSNILIYQEQQIENTKIGDLGRSTCDVLDSPYKDLLFTGDHNYAPPEKDYRINNISHSHQKYLTDCYLLGSLIVFYITGVSINVLLYRNVPKSCMPGVFTGSMEQLNADLQNAFSQAIEEVREYIPEVKFKERLIECITYLCNPDITKRGHPKNLRQKYGNPYKIERFITTLNLLYKQAELEIYKR